MTYRPIFFIGNNKKVVGENAGYVHIIGSGQRGEIASPIYNNIVNVSDEEITINENTDIRIDSGAVEAVRKALRETHPDGVCVNRATRQVIYGLIGNRERVEIPNSPPGGLF